MTLVAGGLLAAYMLVALLLLNLGLRSPWPWPVKAGAIVVTGALYVVTWEGLQAMSGWPSDQPPPAELRVVATEVREPGPGVGAPGVYIWAVPLDSPELPPRAYRLDYTAELHAKVTEARKMEQMGRPVIAESATGADGDRTLNFRQLPRRRLPAKPGSP